MVNNANEGEWLRWSAAPRMRVERQHHRGAAPLRRHRREERPDLCSLFWSTGSPEEGMLMIRPSGAPCRVDPRSGNRGAGGRGSRIARRYAPSDHGAQVGGDAAGDRLHLQSCRLRRGGAAGGPRRCPLTDGSERAAIREIAERRVETLSDEDLGVLGYDDWLRGPRGGSGVAPRRSGTCLPGDRGGVLRRRPAPGGVRHRDAVARDQHAARSVVTSASPSTGGPVGHPTSGEYLQLTGRAGRRGLDEEATRWRCGHRRLRSAKSGSRGSPPRPPLGPSGPPTAGGQPGLTHWDRANEVLRRSDQWQAERADLLTIQLSHRVAVARGAASNSRTGRSPDRGALALDRLRVRPPPGRGARRRPPPTVPNQLGGRVVWPSLWFVATVPARPRRREPDDRETGLTSWSGGGARAIKTWWRGREAGEGSLGATRLCA